MTDHVASALSNKIADERFAALDRDQRIDETKRRLTHCLDQYVEHSLATDIGHNLIAGRDSRMSFGLFMERHKEGLTIETTGLPHLCDQVVANYAAKIFGLRKIARKKRPRKLHFDYRDRMKHSRYEQYLIPMFRRHIFRTRYDATKFIATGYLGNVVSSQRNFGRFFFADNRYGLKESAFRAVAERNAGIFERLTGVHDDDAAVIFNVMFNSTNKVSSVSRRMKQDTFCVLEMDVFLRCHLLENDEQWSRGSLHYHILRQAHEPLLSLIPFEANKSFADLERSFELQAFWGFEDPRLYKTFLERNFEIVREHIEKHLHELRFSVKFPDIEAPASSSGIQNISRPYLRSFIDAFRHRINGQAKTGAVAAQGRPRRRRRSDPVKKRVSV